MIVYIHSDGKLQQSFHVKAFDPPRKEDVIKSFFDDDTCNGRRIVMGVVKYVNLSYENGKLVEVNITLT